MIAPRWAAALLRFLARPGHSDDVVGDLHEMHGRRVRRRGRLVAHALTAVDALDMAVALVRTRRDAPIGSAPPGGKPAYGTVAGNLRGPQPGIGEDLNNRKRWQMRRWLENWQRDFHHAARALRRAPGFTIVTVTTLALAIGSNAAIFSVVDSVLIDPLPFPNADRLVSIRASAFCPSARRARTVFATTPGRLESLR